MVLALALGVARGSAADVCLLITENCECQVGSVEKVSNCGSIGLQVKPRKGHFFYFVGRRKKEVGGVKKRWEA